MPAQAAGTIPTSLRYGTSEGTPCPRRLPAAGLSCPHVRGISQQACIFLHISPTSPAIANRMQSFSIERGQDVSTGTVDFLRHGCPCLQVGNGGLTLNEQRSHFALWSLLKSPLMVGTDLAKLPPEGFQILLAKEVIAVNQDPLGVAGDLVWKEGPSEVRPPPTESPRPPSISLFARRFEQCLSTHCPLMLLSAMGYTPSLSK